jgi:hypothetical protein
MLLNSNPPFYIEIEYLDCTSTKFIQLANSICKTRKTAIKRAIEWCEQNNHTYTFIDATLCKYDLEHPIDQYLLLTL